MGGQSGILFFNAFSDDLFSLATYDKTTFPNNEGINFWSSIVDRFSEVVEVSDRIVELAVAPNSIFLETSKNIELSNKSLIFSILMKFFRHCSLSAQESFLSLLVSYLKSTDKISLFWGIERVIELESIVNINEYSSSVTELLFSELLKILNSIENASLRLNLLKLLLKHRESVCAQVSNAEVTLSPQALKVFLGASYDPVVFEAVLSFYENYTLDEKISISARSLDKEIFDFEHSFMVLDAMEFVFNGFSDSQLDNLDLNNFVADFRDVLKLSNRLEFLENVCLHIALDERAWRFVADFFDKVVISLSDVEVSVILKWNSHSLCTISEIEGVVRNRFSLLVSLHKIKKIKKTDVNQILNRIFTGEDMNKIYVAAQCLRIFYPISRVLPKRQREMFRGMLENVLAREIDSKIETELRSIIEIL